MNSRTATALGGLLLAGAAACGGGSSGHGGAPGAVPAAEVQAYVGAVQGVRLPVNTLLLKADPITEAYEAKAITPLQASHRMARLEARFANYLLKVQQIHPTNPQLEAIHRPYADTYFYEDAYLSALASDFRDGDFDNLPNTGNQQRLAIIIWRTKLEMIAGAAGVSLPPDLQQAGRGEIAPDSPEAPSRKGKTGRHATS